MRTFIAVTIKDAARATLNRYLAELRARYTAGVRWSRPENVHLTLRFLGEVSDRDLAGVTAAASKAAAAAGSFTLRLGAPAHLGKGTPRVLSLSVGGQVEELAALHAALEAHLEKSGFGRDSRRFRPHLTLGRRKKGPIPEDWRQVPRSGATDWDVDEIVVFSSTLTPTGPIYTPLARCPLGCAADSGKGPSEPNKEL
jgi:2'-5' RNA ligase